MMFYLLKCNYKKKRGLFSRLFSPSVNVMEHSLLGVRYFVLEAYTKGEPDWHRIASVLGKNEYIILPEGLTLPEGLPFKNYPTDWAKGKLIADGALSVIEQAAKQNPNLSVMLIDKMGKYAYLLPALMRCAQTVTAVTAQGEEYDQSARCLLNSLGASPLITDDATCASVCNVIIAPEGIAGCGTLPLPAMIFAPTGCDCITVGSDNINMGSFTNFEGYDKLQLAAAVFRESEFSGIAPYAESMCLRGKNVPIAELAQMLI